VAEPRVLACAEALGKELAQRRCDLVCGGLRGVMEAAARGLRFGRGTADVPVVIGILPGGDASKANPFCDVVLPSGLGVARNALVVRAADAVIVLAGGSGTLAEAALGWQLGKPIIALRDTGGWAAQLADKPIDDSRDDLVLSAADPVAAVAAALGRLG